MDQTPKNIFTSKTFWTNLLAPVFLWLATHYGINLDPQTQGYVIIGVMMLVNIGLRYITKQPVTFSFATPVTATPTTPTFPAPTLSDPAPLPIASQPSPETTQPDQRTIT
jgi:hypothetical protein